MITVIFMMTFKRWEEMGEEAGVGNSWGCPWAMHLLSLSHTHTVAGAPTQESDSSVIVHSDSRVHRKCLVRMLQGAGKMSSVPM